MCFYTLLFHLILNLLMQALHQLQLVVFPGLLGFLAVAQVVLLSPNSVLPLPGLLLLPKLFLDLCLLLERCILEPGELGPALTRTHHHHNHIILKQLQD